VRPVRWLAAVGLSASLLAGCGGTEPPSLSPEAAQVLASDVDAVAAAARSQDVAALGGALQALRGHVEHYSTLEEISPERASRILAAAARVATDVQPAAPQPAPEPAASAAPAPAVRPAAPAAVEDPPAPAPASGDDDGDRAKDKAKDRAGKGEKAGKGGRGGRGGKGD
jgi:cytoskeletal protein RodZ